MTISPSKHRILVVDDELLMREYVEEALLRAGYLVDTATNGADGLALFEIHQHDVVVTDLKMTPMDGLAVLQGVLEKHPETRVIVMTAYGTIETAVRALKGGATDYILKPFAPDVLELAVTRALELARLTQENRYLREELNTRYDSGAMVGFSPAMEQVKNDIAKVVDSRATVLIRGSSGTGKELVARAIHHGGSRANKPFIKVNCAALSAGILESELFGHEKGAFTGAHDRKIGRFELADGGTLLLDEVSEINIELQAKLLRALQERLPPLRERRDDIPRLAEHFFNVFNRENGRNLSGISLAAREALVAYSWPGNVRELQNAIERAVVLASGNELTPEDFQFNTANLLKSEAPQGLTAGTTVSDMECQLIFATLEHCNQNRTRASELLGISVRTLRNKLKEYQEAGIEVPSA